MSGHCARCACGQIPEQWCAGCPNRPQPIGKTWAEESIEKWLEMEPGDDATMLLREIMRENWKQSIKREPRRLFRGTVFLRRYGARDKRLGRVGKAQFRQYHAEGLSWPFGVHARPDGVTADRHQVVDTKDADGS